MSKALTFISIFLSLTCTVFYVVGAIGYTDQHSVLKNIAWITAEKDGFHQFFGLYMFYLTVPNGINSVRSYADCYGDVCDTCESNGKSAFGLCILCAILSGVTLGLSYAHLTIPSTLIQLSSALTAAGSCGFAIIALGLFMSECYDLLEGATPLELSWGHGAILTIVAMLTMAGVTVIQVVNSFVPVEEDIYSDISGSEPVPSESETPTITSYY